MLDKTKKYGLICGGGGARYEQGGKFYNLAEEECTETGEPIGKKARAQAVVEEADETSAEAPVEDAKPPKRNRWSKP